MKKSKISAAIIVLVLTFAMPATAKKKNLNNHSKTKQANISIESTDTAKRARNDDWEKFSKELKREWNEFGDEWNELFGLIYTEENKLGNEGKLPKNIFRRIGEPSTILQEGNSPYTFIRQTSAGEKATLKTRLETLAKWCDANNEDINKLRYRYPTLAMCEYCPKIKKVHEITDWN